MEDIDVLDGNRKRVRSAHAPGHEDSVFWEKGGTSLPEPPRKRSCCHDDSTQL
jgi:hypothetical protein